jgi:hypothetical protein
MVGLQQDFLSIAVIFVFIVVDSFLRFSASFPPREVVFYSSRGGLIDHILAFNFVLLVFSSPLLLSLFLLRRLGSVRVLLHAACVLYILVV